MSSPLQGVEPTLVIQLPSRRGHVIAASLLATLCIGIAIAVLSGNEDEPAAAANPDVISSSEGGAAEPRPPGSSEDAPGAADPAGVSAEEPPPARVAASSARQSSRPSARQGVRSSDRSPQSAETNSDSPALTTAGRQDQATAAPAATGRADTDEAASPEGDEQATRAAEKAAVAMRDTNPRQAAPRTVARDTTDQPPAAPPAARVDILSTPAGAIVRIDGRVKGETPLTGLQMAANEAHAIELSHTGYDTWRGRVRPKPGQVTAVTASLAPIAQPAKTAAAAPPPSTQRDVRVPRAMVGNADRGKGLYARCQSCHGATAPGLSPRRYTQKQWIRYLASRRHGRHDPLGARFAQSELADIKAYLLDNAADVDRAMVPGVR